MLKERKSKCHTRRFQFFKTHNRTQKTSYHLMLLLFASTSSSAAVRSRFSSSIRNRSFFTSVSYCSIRLPEWFNSVALSANVFFNLTWTCFRSFSSWNQKSVYYLYWLLRILNCRIRNWDTRYPKSNWTFRYRRTTNAVPKPSSRVPTPRCDRWETVPQKDTRIPTTRTRWMGGPSQGMMLDWLMLAASLTVGRARLTG